MPTPVTLIRVGFSYTLTNELVSRKGTRRLKSQISNIISDNDSITSVTVFPFVNFNSTVRSGFERQKLKTNSRPLWNTKNTGCLFDSYRIQVPRSLRWFVNSTIVIFEVDLTCGRDRVDSGTALSNSNVARKLSARNVSKTADAYPNFVAFQITFRGITVNPEIMWPEKAMTDQEKVCRGRGA